MQRIDSLRVNARFENTLFRVTFTPFALSKFLILLSRGKNLNPEDSDFTLLKHTFLKLQFDRNPENFSFIETLLLIKLLLTTPGHVVNLSTGSVVEVFYIKQLYICMIICIQFICMHRYFFYKLSLFFPSKFIYSY